MSRVTIQQVKKSYHHQVVLDQISFVIEEGEFMTLLGPSGCGKSTLLRAIAGLNEIDSGAILIGDQDITHLPPRARQVGMVFQSYALFPNMTVFENIAFGLKMSKMKKSEYTPQVEEMIALIELTGKENRYPSQLSGGQQQRVALARSLVKRPKVLLLDEPLSALDAKIRRSIRDQIRLIQKKLKMTTIFVTHDQEEALTISDRIVVMNQGNIEQIGTPEQIYTAPQTEFVARFIGNYNVWSRSDMDRLGWHGLPEGELFAVRPEAIRLLPQQETEGLSDLLRAEGTLKMTTVLGNVIRYELDVQGIPVTVDLLHGEGARRLPEGERIGIALDRKACLAVKKQA